MKKHLKKEEAAKSGFFSQSTHCIKKRKKTFKKKKKHLIFPNSISSSKNLPVSPLKDFYGAIPGQGQWKNDFHLALV